MSDKTENLAAESNAAVNAGKVACGILITTAKAFGSAWGKLAEVFEPLSFDEAKVAAKIARDGFKEWASKAGISDKAAAVYLSEFLRCKFNGREIPKSRKGYKEYLKDASFGKMTNAGARPKGTKPSDGEEGEGGTTDASGGQAAEDAEAMDMIVANVKRAHAAGLDLNAINIRLAGMLSDMLAELAEIQELEALLQADMEADEAAAEDAADVLGIERTGTEG